MIVLLSYSISSLGSDVNAHSSTGVVNSNDSVLIAYDDLRIANSKMIELEYEKQKNILLKNALTIDSILLQTKDEFINQVQEDKRQANKQRNIAIIGGGTSLLLLLLVSIFK